jgi:hypothetical protein
MRIDKMADLITNIGNRRCYFEFGHNDSGTEHHTFARVIVLGEDGQMLRIEKPILAYAQDSVEALALCTDEIVARNTNYNK